MGADEAAEVVDILLANTPSERTAVLDDLVRSEKISKIVADEIQESLSTFTAPLTVTTAAGVSPNED
jgi:transposase-like protein